VPGRLALAVSGEFADTDANGYRDTTPVVAYIFADSLQYTIPLRARGTFRFELADPATGATLASWTFDEHATSAALRDLAVGPGFIFELSLLAQGGDRLDAREASVVATFEPARAGHPLKAISPPVIIGKN